MAILGIFRKKKRARARTRPAKSKPKHVRKAKSVRPKPKHKILRRAAKPVKRAHGKVVRKIARPVRAPPAPKLPPVVKMPDEKAYDMLKAARIPLAPYAFVKRDKDLPVILKKIKFPAVMKVSGPAIMHKTELGGIVKNIGSESAAADAFKRLMMIKGAEKVVVQKQMSGIELIVGAKSDPQFGYIVSVGIGGIYVEVLRDVAFRVAPISTTDAAAMVRELKGYEILAGMRGAAPINFAALYDVLTKVSRLVGTAKLKELDINPLFCTPEGCAAADVRAIKG